MRGFGLGLFYFLLPQLGERVVIGYRDMSLRRKFGGSRGSRIDQWQKEQFYAKETVNFPLIVCERLKPQCCISTVPWTPNPAW